MRKKQVLGHNRHFHLKDPITAFFCPYPGCSHVVYNLLGLNLDHHGTWHADNHLALEHQDFRGGKDAFQGRAFDLLNTADSRIL